MFGLSGAALPLLVQATPRRALAQAGGATSSLATLDVAQHRQATLMVGSFAKQTSQLALQRATHPAVKQFAGFEDAEQTTIAQVLTNTQNPPPAPLDANEQAMLRQLKVAAGPAFDHAYVQGQIMGHQQLLGIQEAFLRGQPSMATDAVHVAMLARTVIQMHLTMLHDLARTVRT
jgi:putative membrane protein